MDLKQLKYFLSVVEHGSFSRASRALDIAQPALSRQVRKLEVELKQNLLQRTGRGVRCTDAGELMAKHARSILQKVATAQLELNQIRGVISGHVTIGMPTSLSKLLTVPLISSLKEKLPDVTFSLSDGLSVTTQELLVDQRLDIAVLFEPEPSPDIDITPVMEQALFLVCGAGFADKETAPISLAEVAARPLVIPRAPHGIRVLVEAAMKEIHQKPKISMEADSVHMILDFLVESPGYAVLPLHSIANYADLDRFFYRRIVQPNLYSQLCLAVLSRHSINSIQRSALKVVLDVCRSGLISAIRRSLQQASLNLSSTDKQRLDPIATVRLIDPA